MSEAYDMLIAQMRYLSEESKRDCATAEQIIDYTQCMIEIGKLLRGLQ
jgi:hypothetical protein